MEWNRYLGLIERIDSAESFEKLANRFWITTLRVYQVILFSIQLECRGDSSECHLDCLGMNFVLPGRNASGLYMLGKGCQEVNLEFVVEAL